MHRLPQPVPPIFQPEVAARAVELAIDSRRRELRVGYPTVFTILGQRLAPGLLDRYLGMSGFDSQLTEEPDPGDRPDNLESPVDGDFGARGVFDHRSRSSSWALDLSAHLPQVAGAGLAAVGLLGASMATRRR
jgi:hypothetical protein